MDLYVCVDVEFFLSLESTDNREAGNNIIYFSWLVVDSLYIYSQYIYAAKEILGVE